MPRTNPCQPPIADTERQQSGVSSRRAWLTHPALLIIVALVLITISQELFVRSRTPSTRYLEVVVVAMDAVAFCLFVTACVKFLRRNKDRPKMTTNENVKE